MQSNDPATTYKNIPQVLSSAQNTHKGYDNLWPNPTSEDNPPAGVTAGNDGNSAEWDYRAFVGSPATCTFTASIAGTVMTVTAVSSGGLGVGQLIKGPGVAANTHIASLGTGTGGTGTYNLDVSQSISSTGLNATGAYAGTWVRKLINAGTTPTPPSLTVPCSPDEQFFASVWAKSPINFGSIAGIIMSFYDASGTQLASSLGAPFAQTSTWTLVTVTATAPAAAVTVTCKLSAPGQNAEEFQYDAIIFRRMSTPGMITAGAAGQIIGMSGGVPAWIANEAWNAPTLGGGFANFGAPFLNAGYFIDVNGAVHLRGLVKNVAGCAAGTTIFTLPAGYRPSSQARFSSAGEGNPTLFFSIDVLANGQVQVTLAVAANGFRALDGITFDTR